MHLLVQRPLLGRDNSRRVRDQWHRKSTFRIFCHVLSIQCAQIIQLSPSRRPTAILTLDPSPLPPVSSSDGPAAPDRDSTETPTPYAITSVAWAPSCGRSYHLIATGGRDGHVRIWRVKPGEDGDDGEGDEGRWTGNIVADFDHHK